MSTMPSLLVFFGCAFFLPALVSSASTSDITFASFQSVVDMPYAMSDMVATSFPDEFFSDGHGPRIYLTGGCTSDQSCPDATDSSQGTCFCTQITSSVIYFAPQTKTFFTVASMPQKRYRHMAARVGRYLFVAGGRNLSDVVLQDIDRYDVVTNVWETVTQWPNATSDGVAFAKQHDENTDLFYLAGGYQQDYSISGNLTALNITSLTFDLDYPSMSVPRGDVQVAVLSDDDFYVIGGWSDSQFCHPSNVVEYFSVSRHAWFTAQSMHEGRGDLVCGVLSSDMLFAVAGETKNASDSTCMTSVPVPDVERYLGPVNNTWAFEEDIPLGLFRFSGATYNTTSSLYSSAIYLFGGQSTFNRATKSFAVRNSTLVYFPEVIYGSRRKQHLDAGGIAGIVVAGIVVLGCILTALVAFFGYRYSRYRYLMLEEEQQMQQQTKQMGNVLEMQAMQDSFPSANRV